MSLGYAGCCKKELEDEETVIYSYRAENWNLPKEEREHVEAIEGMFTIDKASLEEPAIRRVRSRMSKGRRGFVEKRFMHPPDIQRHIREGGITIDKLSGVDQLEQTDGAKLPRCLCHLLFRVYASYMENGELPEQDCFIQ